MKRNENVSMQLALFIVFNALEVHEALSSLGRLVDPLSMRPRKGARIWLIEQWRKVLSVNYEPVFELAVKVLELMPSHPLIERVVNRLANIASSVVSSKALLKHDIAGRIYHTLLFRDVAKGLATYYTSIPAAHLLAKLAMEGEGIDFDKIIRKNFVIADLACGSGTLLSAAYTAVLDKYIMSKLEHGDYILKEDLKSFHKKMLEERLFGFDVLEYASHLAATWLTLRAPEAEVDRVNIYTLPLGGERDIWLGSLSIETNDPKVCVVPLAMALTREMIGPKGAGLKSRERRSVKMPRPNLIIMNPPFARTGNVGRSILLGHLPASERKSVLRKLRDYSKVINKRLGGAVGKAGLAPMFVWLAHRCLADHGRLAFVLPRVMMSGPSWEPIRNLLTENYKINHVVVCYDPEKNWAWSENTVLSEILLMCTRRKNSDSNVKVSYVFKRPRSALEAKILASQITEIQKPTERDGFSDEENIGLATVYQIKQDLLRNQRNWNICIGFSSVSLSHEAWNIHANLNFLGYDLPITSLEKQVMKIQVNRGRRIVTEPAIGFDVATYQRCKSPQGKFLLDVLEGANISTLNKIEIPPNARVTFNREDLSKRASNFLIAGVGRFWLYTIGLISVFCNKPVISNTMWTVKLRDESIQNYKLQTLWLNSTPGLLNVLSLRQDSKGAFVQFKKEYLPMTKLINVKRLESRQKEKMIEIYNQIKRIRVPSIPIQLEEALSNRGFRYIVDSQLLKILCPTFKVSQLKSIYTQLLRETIIKA